MPKRSSLAILLIIFISEVAFAAPGVRKQASMRAQSFLSEMGRRAEEAPAYVATRSDGKPSYYVFNAAEGQGFVFVAADDACDVIGYTDGGSFDADEMPEALSEWLQASGAAAPLSAMPLKAANYYDEIPVMLTTTWQQNAPYNELCPMLNGEHCHTGCVAAALAQIMYYHRWPQGETKAIPGYEPNRLYDDFEEDGLPATTFEWDLMRDDYTGQESEAEIQAVAKLMAYAGYAAKMNYAAVGQSVAAVGSPLNVLLEYFDYDPGAHMVSLTDYSVSQWDQLIYDELAAGRPVLISGATADTGKPAIGHQFVCDGYKKGFFHINWGLPKKYNGYFKFSALQADLDYTHRVRAVVGIQPNAGSPASHPRPVCERMIINGSYLDIQSYVYEVNPFYYGSAIGRIDEVTGEPVFLQFNNVNEGHEGSGYENSFRFNSLNLPSGTTQFLVPLYCESEKGVRNLTAEADWKAYNPYGRYIEVDLEQGGKSISERHFTGHLKLEGLNFIGMAEAGAPLTLEATVRNVGDSYSGDVYFYIMNPEGDKKLLLLTAVELDYMEETVIPLTCTLEMAGEYTVYGIMETKGLSMGCKRFNAEATEGMATIHDAGQPTGPSYSVSGIRLDKPATKGVTIRGSRKIIAK